MADTRGDDDDVPLLEPVAFRAHQILHAGGGPAADQLVEGVAVQLHHCRGVAHIPVSIDKTGGHFQLLIPAAGVNAQAAQVFKVFLLLTLVRRYRHLFNKLVQFV